mmetsp:Transcript_21880/g.47422  ORF Transcript_21880/g.47422 Transcript_21880/m.47422 type:complete len:84 (-) Transcript_21880:459-710(-)
MKTARPPRPIAGAIQIIRNAPIHPIVIYIVMLIHLGSRPGPSVAVRYIPTRAKNQATPKKLQPITESCKNTKHNGLNVPAMSG